MKTLCDDIIIEIFNFLEFPKEFLLIRLTSKDFERLFQKYLNIINTTTNFKQKIIVFEYFRKKKKFIKCGNSLCGSVGTKELYVGPCFDCGSYYCKTCTFNDDVKATGIHGVSLIKEYCSCRENFIFLKFYKCKKCEFPGYCEKCEYNLCNNKKCTKRGHKWCHIIWPFNNVNKLIFIKK